MATIIRTNRKQAKKFPAFGGQINIWAYKTKTMNREQQEQLVEDNPEQFPSDVRIQVTYKDGSAVLVDVIVPLEEFDTGSIGYKFKIVGATFEEV